MIKNILALLACVVLFSAPLKAAEGPSYSYFSLEGKSWTNASMGTLYWSSELSDTGYMWIDWAGITSDNGCIADGYFTIGGGLKFDLGDASSFDIGLGYGANSFQDTCSGPNTIDSSITDLILGLRFGISDSAEGYIRSKTTMYSENGFSDEDDTGYGVVFYLGPFVGIEIGVGTRNDADYGLFGLRFKR